MRTTVTLFLVLTPALAMAAARTAELLPRSAGESAPDDRGGCLRLWWHSRRRCGGGAGGAHGQKSGARGHATACRWDDFRRTHGHGHRQSQGDRRLRQRGLCARSARLRGFRPSEGREGVSSNCSRKPESPSTYEHRLKGCGEGRQRASRRSRSRTATRCTRRCSSTPPTRATSSRRRACRFTSAARATPPTAKRSTACSFARRTTFSVPVDPYREPGDPASGLLPLASPPSRSGQGRRRRQEGAGVQLPHVPLECRRTASRSRNPTATTAIATRCSSATCSSASPHPRCLSRLHNGDCNNTGGFSTDHIGANYAWPEGRLRHAREDLPGPRELPAGAHVVLRERPASAGSIRAKTSPRSACTRASFRKPAAGRTSSTSAKAGA